MQAEVKSLRRLNCILESAPADTFLSGLQQHCMQGRLEAVSTALGEVAAAHAELRSAINSTLARPGWALIQEAIALAAAHFQEIQQTVGAE